MELHYFLDLIDLDRLPNLVYLFLAFDFMHKKMKVSCCCFITTTSNVARWFFPLSYLLFFILM